MGILVKILGWLWIAAGFLFFIKPNMLARILQKRSIRRIKKYLFAFAIFAGILLIKTLWGIEGILPKVIMVMGLVAIIKGLFLIKGKVAERITGWFSKQPVSFF